MRSFVVSLVLLVTGAAAALWITSAQAPTEPALDRRAAGRAPTRAIAREGRPDDSRQRARLERQIQLLMARVADEAAKRQRLETQVEALSARLAALAHGSARPESPAEAPAQPASAGGAEDRPESDAAASAPSAMERALIAAGIDPGTAADMKRRHDDLAMAEIYLRDEATREQWLDSPRFRDELAAIDAQRVSVRDEIGDDAYDRYLYAQGQTNRVRVDDVMLDSVAAQAGLQNGDIVLRYGEDRIFAPEDLVNATRSGHAGESTPIEILRNGTRLEVQVPRGPLGLRIAGTQLEPAS